MEQTLSSDPMSHYAIVPLIPEGSNLNFDFFDCVLNDSLTMMEGFQDKQQITF